MVEFCLPPGLDWLPEPQDWSAHLRTARAEPDPLERWRRYRALSLHRMDLSRTAQLDREVQASFTERPAFPEIQPLRLAMVGSSTQTHLHAAIRAAGLRRGFLVEIDQADYGVHLQAMTAADGPWRDRRPDAVLIGLDATFATQAVRSDWDRAAAEAGLEQIMDHLRTCWSAARALSGCVVQQSFAPVFPRVFGNNEQRLPSSRAGFLTRLNARVRSEADAAGVDILALDEAVGRYGLQAWWDPAYWHAAKQEIRPAAAAMYGELAMRLLAARRGQAAKCLVLDLDNTLWGGVVGDDGIDHLTLGQGSAAGESFLDLQRYAQDLAGRGVVLAVCSKNDEATALSVFEHHPEMLLKRRDIACFVANWDDKATNLRRIATQLNLGLSSLVFVDDNPFERNLVRETLPMVAVPELPDDPALYAQTLSDAGYFEGVALTSEDIERNRLYETEARRARARDAAPSVEAYLSGLEMRLDAAPFRPADRQRIVQLINKTNQFNLMTRRYDDREIEALESAQAAFGLRFRLSDRFGDHGIVAAVVCRLQDDEAVIDTWLMSCRVLGRGLEAAILNVIFAQARQRGAKRLIGHYRATTANGIVRDHYNKLGFTSIAPDGDTARWACDVSERSLRETFVTISEN